MTKAKTKIGETEKDALWFSFLNNTGSIIYLTNARIINCSKLFRVDLRVFRDISKSSYELKFHNESADSFSDRQIILQTNSEKASCITLENSVTDGMLSYKPHWIRKLFRCPKYFKLEYVAMVGSKKYQVSTVY